MKKPCCDKFLFYVPYEMGRESLELPALGEHCYLDQTFLEVVKWKKFFLVKNCCAKPPNLKFIGLISN